jgi:hypothetical protein
LVASGVNRSLREQGVKEDDTVIVGQVSSLPEIFLGLCIIVVTDGRQLKELFLTDFATVRCLVHSSYFAELVTVMYFFADGVSVERLG